MEVVLARGFPWFYQLTFELLLPLMVLSLLKLECIGVRLESLLLLLLQGNCFLGSSQRIRIICLTCIVSIPVPKIETKFLKLCTRSPDVGKGLEVSRWVGTLKC